MFCEDRSYLVLVDVTAKRTSYDALKAGFIEPMLCLGVQKLPEGPAWQYEVKLDGYRAIGVRTKGGVELWSRNKRDFSRRFSIVARALEALPVETVLDGEIVAVNSDGRPSFGSLQNFRHGAAAILFYAFDAPVVAGADLCSKPLATRREMLRNLIPSLPDTIRFSETFDASATELMAAVRFNGLEGVVAKRRDGSYKPGDRSGAWVKVRANRRQELVIGGYIPGSTTFDSIVVGYYEGRDLMYAARIRNGFTPASRRTVFSKFEGLSISKCPFRNLPESGKGRWVEGLTAEDMKRCCWLKPQLVATIEFLEWTPEARLRHPKFVAVRDCRIPQEITRQQP
jgi:bifunctional non-homologous end joining protein LigD